MKKEIFILTDFVKINNELKHKIINTKKDKNKSTWDLIEEISKSTPEIKPNWENKHIT